MINLYILTEVIYISSIHITYHFILSAAEATIVLPYIELGITEDVEMYSLPTRDDYVSDAINVEFPFGGSYFSAVHVSIG